jgi:hypothetical protein
MVKQRSQERERQEAVELGQENARLYPQVQNWCRHLQIRMVAAGLLAERYGLPIGSMEITCEHASAGGVQAMQLRDVATSFIVNNCRGCLFREGIDIDNIGHVILSEWEEVQQRRQAELEQTNKAKARLYELVSGNLTEALHQEKITNQSILSLVALLDNQTEHIEAAKKLLQASKIAAELFIDVAIDVICSHFPDSEHGKDCINTIRCLGQKRGQIPEVAFIAAKRCLADDHHADDVCALIGDYVAQCDFVPEPELVDAIIGMQQHGHIVGSNLSSHREYPGSLYALTEIAQRNLDPLINSLRNRLSNNNKFTRINTVHVIQSLINTFPALALSLINPLIDSLELDDDDYDDSADEVACVTLAAIYVCHPEETQKALEIGYQRASAEAKILIYEVYRCLVRGASAYSTPIANKSLYGVCIPRIISFLLQTISGEYPIEVKEAAAKAVGELRKNQAAALVNKIDTILGILANLVHEQVLLDSEHPQNTLGQLKKQLNQGKYSNTVGKLVGTLKAICALKPREVLIRLKQLLPNLDSKQAHLANYKSRLTALYGSLGTNYELIPEVIPDLYDLLLDFDSVLVRGAAVQAISKILEQRADVIPQNMLDLVVTYLNDCNTYIHQSSVHAMRYVRPSNLEEAVEIASRLINLDRAYKQDTYFRLEILRAIIHITNDYKELLVKVTVPEIVEHAHITEQNVAEHALEIFECLLSRLPEEYTKTFAREVLAFIGRSQSRFNGTKRAELLLKLYELPREAIVANLSVLQETASKKAKDAPWDAISMVQLLSYFELYAEAAKLAQEILAVQPQSKRYEAVVREATVMRALAQTEIFVAQGKVDEALQVLQQITPSEAQLHENTEARDI